jgi:hypothetical protein
MMRLEEASEIGININKQLRVRVYYKQIAPKLQDLEVSNPLDGLALATSSTGAIELLQNGAVLTWRSW